MDSSSNKPGSSPKRFTKAADFLDDLMLRLANSGVTVIPTTDDQEATKKDEEDTYQVKWFQGKGKK